MSSRWVVNASPLILLGKIYRLHLLRDLAGELIIPRGVADEVRVKPDGQQALNSLVIERSLPRSGLAW